MAVLQYNGLIDTLLDSKKEVAERFKAAVEMTQRLEQSPEFAKLVAADVKRIIHLVKTVRENPIVEGAFDVLFFLSQKPDIKDDLLKGGFPEYCLECMDVEKFRFKSAQMIIGLLRTSKLIDELVEMGMVDVLLKYADYIDKGCLAQKPHFILKVRLFVSICLAIISEIPEHLNLLIEKNVLQKVKTCFLRLNLAQELSRILPQNLVMPIKNDEDMMHTNGLNIISNLIQRFENFGRINKEIRKEEVKYLFDYESDHESVKGPPTLIPELSDRKKNKLETAFDNEENKETSKLLLTQVNDYRLVEDMVEASVQFNANTSLHGLKLLYRIAGVLHLFMSIDIRASIVNNLLGLAQRFSGQRRHNCFAVLLVLARQVENCNMFISTSIFRTMFFLGMEESGEVLNQLLKVLRALSVHTSTAQEFAVRSDCSKLLFKVLHEDFKGKVNFPVNGTKEEKEKAIDETPALCVLTLFNLIQKSRECSEFMVKAGAIPVLTQIAIDHPKDVIGMLVVTSLSTLRLSTEPELTPFVSKEMVNILLDALNCCLKGEPYESIIFPARKITLCLQNLCFQKSNVAKIANGLPLFIKVYQTFIDDYGKKEKELISKRTVGHVSKILQEISTIKNVLTKLVELGDGFLDLLAEVEQVVAEAKDTTVFETENDVCVTLQYVQLSVSDELSLVKEREVHGDKLRKSSKIAWADIFQERVKLVQFMGKERYDFEL